MQVVVEFMLAHRLSLILLLLVCSSLLVRLYIRLAQQWGVIDVPNLRSSHTQVTPRGGGVVFVLIWLVALIFFSRVDSNLDLFIIVSFPGALLMALIGWWDDVRGISAKRRFLVHLLAAIAAVYAMRGFNVVTINSESWQLGAMGSVCAIFALVWSSNLFNFMDGTDGIAGIEALFVFGVGGTILLQNGASSLAWAAWFLCAVLVGFLTWNWPKAKVFMGDVGSGFLGFLIVVFALIGDKYYHVSVLVWVVLYSIFWVDASVTLIRRIVRGEPWLSPHRSHAYQRLHHIAGWSHTKILVSVIGTNLALAGIALAAQMFPNLGLMCFAFSTILVILLYGLVEKIAPMPLLGR